MDWTSIGAIGLAVGAVLGAVLAGLGILEKLASWAAKAWRIVVRKPATADYPPAQTLILIPRPQPGALFWHMGNDGGQPPNPMMQIAADLNVTNLWQADVLMAAAVVRYRKMGLFPQEQLGHAMVIHGGNNRLAPNTMTWVRIHFLFAPPWKDVGESLTADIAVIDQFNNYHWLRRQVFPYM